VRPRSLAAGFAVLGLVVFGVQTLSITLGFLCCPRTTWRALGVSPGPVEKPKAERLPGGYKRVPPAEGGAEDDETAGERVGASCMALTVNGIVFVGLCGSIALQIFGLASVFRYNDQAAIRDLQTCDQPLVGVTEVRVGVG
jgi:hypothetical protein